MTNDPWESVWEHMRTGRHAIVIGPSALPTVPSDLKVVRVNCEVIGSSGGALDVAHCKVMRLLGEDLLPSGPTPGQLEAGFRRGLLGELPGSPLEAQLVIDEVAAPFALTALPPDVLRVLLAASMFGSTFEADMVARLLDEPLGNVLEKLQGAADVGATLADRGEGQFSLPPDAIGALQSRILPSLLTFWHARLGEILSGQRLVGRRAAPMPYEEGMLSSEPQPAAREPTADEAGALVDIPKTAPTTAPEAPHPGPSYASRFEPARESGAPSQLTQGKASPAALADAVTQAHGPGAADLRGAVEAVERHLTQAESVLGRMELPGEERA